MSVTRKTALKIVAPSKTRPIRLSGNLWDALKSYSIKTGVPVQRAIDEAVDDFVRNVVPARLEAFGGSYQKDTKHVVRGSK